MKIQSNDKTISMSSGELYLAPASTDSHAFRFETRTDSIGESLKMLQHAVKVLELFQQVYNQSYCDELATVDHDEF